MTLHTVDYFILSLYFLFVLGIGWYLKGTVSTSSDFLTSRHSVPLWITSLAFVAANLGAQELIGMCASGAKYGIMTAHFYWVGSHSGHGLHGCVHDAVLFWKPRPIGSRIFEAAVR
jgi:SSS family solute:Na+ symporter